MSRPAFIPAAFVWSVYGIVAALVVVTYSRVPPGDLYHVTGTGIAGGLGRALVLSNFPVALAALPFTALAADRLRGRPWAVAAAVASACLCAVVVWPGVVDQDDLDARAVNALPALGVAGALALTVVAGLFSVRARIRPAVAVFALGLALLALPWLAAELGFYLDGVPVLGRIFFTGTLYQGEPAVHHGHHHGLDGVLLAVTALALVPLIRRMEGGRLRVVTGAYLGLQLAYGLANVANDAWFEQLVKRGVLHRRIPSVLNPTVSLPWLVILVAGAAFAVVILRPVRGTSSIP